MSMSLFKKIFQQAEKTFSARNKDSYKSNLALLKKLVDMLVYSDFQISPLLTTKKAFAVKNKAPCTYINIYEKKDSPFSMSIFIIDENYKMPLHDHPHMTGMLKVLSGKLKIESYSQITTDKENGIYVNADTPKILDATSEATILYPDKSNFHELTAIEGPSAFFDILSPPYSDITDGNLDARHCSFYRKERVDSNNVTIKLIEIPAPDHYYCDSIYYEMPDFMR